MVDGHERPGAAPPSDAGGLDQAEALHRFWDELVRPDAVHPGGVLLPETGLEPALAVAVRRLHAAADAPAVSAAFADRLRRDLFAEGAADPRRRGGRAEAPGRVLRFVSPVVGPWSWRRAVAQAAMAAVLLAALLGGPDPHSWVPGLAGPTPTVAAEEWHNDRDCAPAATPPRRAEPAAAGAVPTATVTTGGPAGCGRE